MAEERRRPPAQIGAGTGKDGRVTKGDVLAFLATARRPPPPRPAAKAPPARWNRARSA